MKLIVGLGNPGLRYKGTRHNIGYEVLDLFAGWYGVKLKRKWCRARVGDVVVNGETYVCAKPETYMNHSGEAVQDILYRTKKITPAAVLVVCDDINLPLGKMRLRPSGSAGGHHGLESIIHCIRSQDFARLRIGVGVGGNRRDVVDHVLGKFAPGERELARHMVKLGAMCLKSVIEDGIHAAMNTYNKSDLVEEL